MQYFGDLSFEKASNGLKKLSKIQILIKRINYKNLKRPGETMLVF